MTDENPSTPTTESAAPAAPAGEPAPASSGATVPREAVASAAATAPPEAVVPPRRGVARPVRTWDLVLTVVLLGVCLVAVSLLELSVGLLWALWLFSCIGGCDFDAINQAVFLASTVPVVPVEAAGIVAIVLLVRRRIAFWVPLVGLAGGVALLPWGLAGVTAL